MRQMLIEGALLMECGTGILPGLRRFLSTMCFFVVRFSHIGRSWAVWSPPSDPSSSLSSRLFLEESARRRWASCCTCWRRAVEALTVYAFVSGVFLLGGGTQLPGQHQSDMATGYFQRSPVERDEKGLKPLWWTWSTCRACTLDLYHVTKGAQMYSAL